MKILLVNNSQIGGVEYYRMMMPCHILSLNNPEFQFDSIEAQQIREDELILKSVEVYDPETETQKEQKGERVITDEYLKRYDLIHFCRQIVFYQDRKLLDRIKRLGIPFGLDLDDFWHLPEYHIIYNDYKKFNTPNLVIQSIKEAHFVTCTTPILAREIEKYNKNVFIIENGIDTNQESWQPDLKKKERLRFGFYQGATHYEDLLIASTSVREIFKSEKLKDKYQIVLAGFDGPAKDSKGIYPSMAMCYESVLTEGLKHVNPNYKNYLGKFLEEGNFNYINENYFRIWKIPVDDWGYAYKFADVSVIPLLNNRFNRSKSELKLIEAGVKGKAVIVSDTQPYKLLATEKNSFLAKKPIDFYNQIKYCIKNPNAVQDKSEQLREDVLAKYTLEKLTDKRKELYLTYKT